MPYINLIGVDYRTPDLKVIFENLNLQITNAKIGIIGANGIGKSTLLRLILGEIAPQNGNINLNASIAYLPQNLDFNSNLSGGENMIANLRAIFANPCDFIMLDEPSNNLDESAKTYLVNQIRKSNSGLLIISHDRQILEEMDTIFEITNHNIKIYGGNYSFYELQKSIESNAKDRELANALNQEKLINQKIQNRLERKAKSDKKGIAKRNKNDAPKILMDRQKDRAQKTGGAISKLNQRAQENANANLVSARKNFEIADELKIILPKSYLPNGKLVLTCEYLGHSIGEKQIFSNLNLGIIGPKRIHITGKNGAGKSTFFKILAQIISPKTGNCATFAPIAYLDQNLSLLDTSSSIYDNFRNLQPDFNENQTYSQLSRFKFRNKDVHKKIKELSGGERLRAAMAIIFATISPQILLLDEPTNNLDIQSIKILEHALNNYDGCLFCH